MRKLLQGEALEERAIKLGVDIQGPPRTQSTSGAKAPLTHYVGFCVRLSRYFQHPP